MGGGKSNDDSKELGAVTLADGKDTTTTLAPEPHNTSDQPDKLTRKHTISKGMIRLTMKFPHIRHAFRECKKVFDAQVKGGDGLQKSEMKKLLIELGADSEHLTDTEVARIFKTANLDGDDDIDFKEFLIAAAVGCFLNDSIDHEKQSENFKQIRKGFLVAKEAFDFIDEDNGGSIDFEELKAAFSSTKQDEAVCRHIQSVPGIFREHNIGFCALNSFGFHPLSHSENSKIHEITV